MPLISKEHLNMALQSVKKLFDKRIKDSTADWSQNDSDADNYVKNRTHWEKTTTITLVDNLTSEDYRNGSYPKCTFTPDQKYNVVWNGVVYESLVCWYDGEYNVIASEGNGCPFYIDDDGGNGLYIEAESEDGVFTVSINTVETTIHKLDPKYLPDDIGGRPDWNQIDPEAKDYIKNRPFGYGVRDVIVDTTITITDGRCYDINSVDHPYSRDKYIITFDGVEYTGTVYTDSDSCIRTDFITQSGIRVDIFDVYSVYVSNSAGVSKALDGDHTIKIVVERADYSKIKLTDIPDEIQRVEDAVGRKGKGYNAEFFNCTYSNDAVGDYSSAKGRHTKAYGNYSSTKGYNTKAYGDYSDVSGKYNLEDIVYVDDGGTVTNRDYGINVKVLYSETTPILNPKTGKYTVDKLFECTPKEVVSKTNVFLVIGSTGSYDRFYFKTTTDYTRSGSVYSLIDVVEHKSKPVAAQRYAHIVGNGTSDTTRSNAHTLDWEGVGWYQGGLQVGGNAQDDGAKNVLIEGDAIPVPETAEVGQILSVKAVDENGKPTEWEAVDMTGSGGSVDEVYVLSDGETLDDVPEGVEIVIDPDGDPDFDFSGFVQKTELQGVIDTALTQAKESGEFDGKDGVVSVTGATVGQTVKISAVDENGVPTAWSAVDFPSGGSGGGTDAREILCEGTLDFSTANTTNEIPVSMEKLREYKIFGIAVNAPVSTNYRFMFGGTGAHSYGANGQKAVTLLIEWLDDAKTVMSVTCSNFYQNSPFYFSAPFQLFRGSSNPMGFSVLGTDDTVLLNFSVAQTSAVPFCVWGVIK